MTMRYNEARANCPCDDDHKLGTLLDYFLMPEKTGVSLEHIISRVVAKKCGCEVFGPKPSKSWSFLNLL